MDLGELNAHFHRLWLVFEECGRGEQAAARDCLLATAVALAGPVHDSPLTTWLRGLEPLAALEAHRSAK